MNDEEAVKAPGVKRGKDGHVQLSAANDDFFATGGGGSGKGSGSKCAPQIFISIMRCFQCLCAF